MGGAGRPPRFHPGRWLGVLPFFVFSGLFLIGPLLVLVYRSLLDDAGNLTLDNYQALTNERVVAAYWASIRLSVVTAVIGGTFGFLLAWAVSMGKLPRMVRSSVSTFSGVAANFAGVPLVSAFIAVVGVNGLLTVILESVGFDLRATGFSLYNYWGLSLIYLYFQIPLMLLVLLPALDGLKQDWREAAENLGATPRQYWRRVALPILLPSILGNMILLFGNAFGAHATAYALTGGSIPLATLLISQQISGDVLHNPGLGYAVAVGMVLIMSVALIFYTILQRRAERWLR